MNQPSTYNYNTLPISVTTISSSITVLLLSTFPAIPFYYNCGFYCIILIILYHTHICGCVGTCASVILGGTFEPYILASSWSLSICVFYKYFKGGIILSELADRSCYYHRLFYCSPGILCLACYPPLDRTKAIIFKIHSNLPVK